MGLFDRFKKNKTKLDEDSMKYGVALITRDDPKSGISEQYRCDHKKVNELLNNSFDFVSFIAIPMAFGLAVIHKSELFQFSIS